MSTTRTMTKVIVIAALMTFVGLFANLVTVAVDASQPFTLPQFRPKTGSTYNYKFSTTTGVVDDNSNYNIHSPVKAQDGFNHNDISSLMHFSGLLKLRSDCWEDLDYATNFMLDNHHKIHKKANQTAYQYASFHDEWQVHNTVINEGDGAVLTANFEADDFDCTSAKDVCQHLNQTLEHFQKFPIRLFQKVNGEIDSILIDPYDNRESVELKLSILHLLSYSMPSEMKKSNMINPIVRFEKSEADIMSPFITVSKEEADRPLIHQVAYEWQAVNDSPLSLSSRPSQSHSKSSLHWTLHRHSNASALVSTSSFRSQSDANHTTTGDKDKGEWSTGEIPEEFHEQTAYIERLAARFSEHFADPDDEFLVDMSKERDSQMSFDENHRVVKSVESIERTLIHTDAMVKKIEQQVLANSPAAQSATIGNNLAILSSTKLFLQSVDQHQHHARQSGSASESDSQTETDSSLGKQCHAPLLFEIADTLTKMFPLQMLELSQQVSKLEEKKLKYDDHNQVVNFLTEQATKEKMTREHRFASAKATKTSTSSSTTKATLAVSHKQEPTEPGILDEFTNFDDMMGAYKLLKLRDERMKDAPKRLRQLVVSLNSLEKDLEKARIFLANNKDFLPPDQGKCKNRFFQLVSYVRIRPDDTMFASKFDSGYTKGNAAASGFLNLFGVPSTFEAANKPAPSAANKEPAELAPPVPVPVGGVKTNLLDQLTRVRTTIEEACQPPLTSEGKGEGDLQAQADMMYKNIGHLLAVIDGLIGSEKQDVYLFHADLEKIHAATNAIVESNYDQICSNSQSTRSLLDNLFVSVDANRLPKLIPNIRKEVERILKDLDSNDTKKKVAMDAMKRGLIVGMQTLIKKKTTEPEPDSPTTTYLDKSKTLAFGTDNFGAEFDFSFKASGNKATSPETNVTSVVEYNAALTFAMKLKVPYIPKTDIFGIEWVPGYNKERCVKDGPFSSCLTEDTTAPKFSLFGSPPFPFTKDKGVWIRYVIPSVLLTLVSKLADSDFIWNRQRDLIFKSMTDTKSLGYFLEPPKDTVMKMWSGQLRLNDVQIEESMATPRFRSMKKKYDKFSLLPAKTQTPAHSNPIDTIMLETLSEVQAAHEAEQTSMTHAELTATAYAQARHRVRTEMRHSLLAQMQKKDQFLPVFAQLHMENAVDFDTEAHSYVEMMLTHDGLLSFPELIDKLRLYMIALQAEVRIFRLAQSAAVAKTPAKQVKEPNTPNEVFPVEPKTRAQPYGVPNDAIGHLAGHIERVLDRLVKYNVNPNLIRIITLQDKTGVWKSYSSKFFFASVKDVLDTYGRLNDTMVQFRTQGGFDRVAADLSTYKLLIAFGRDPFLMDKLISMITLIESASLSLVYLFTPSNSDILTRSGLDGPSTLKNDELRGKYLEVGIQVAEDFAALTTAFDVFSKTHSGIVMPLDAVAVDESKLTAQRKAELKEWNNQQKPRIVKSQNLPACLGTYKVNSIEWELCRASRSSANLSEMLKRFTGLLQAVFMDGRTAWRATIQFAISSIGEIRDAVYQKKLDNVEKAKRKEQLQNLINEKKKSLEDEIAATQKELERMNKEADEAAKKHYYLTTKYKWASTTVVSSTTTVYGARVTSSLYPYVLPPPSNVYGMNSYPIYLPTYYVSVAPVAVYRRLSVYHTIIKSQSLVVQTGISSSGLSAFDIGIKQSNLKQKLKEQNEKYIRTFQQQSTDKAKQADPKSFDPNNLTASPLKNSIPTQEKVEWVQLSSVAGQSRKPDFQELTNQISSVSWSAYSNAMALAQLAGDQSMKDWISGFQTFPNYYILGLSAVEMASALTSFWVDFSAAKSLFKNNAGTAKMDVAKVDSKNVDAAMAKATSSLQSLKRGITALSTALSQVEDLLNQGPATNCKQNTIVGIRNFQSAIKVVNTIIDQAVNNLSLATAGSSSPDYSRFKSLACAAGRELRQASGEPLFEKRLPLFSVSFDFKTSSVPLPIVVVLSFNAAFNVILESGVCAELANPDVEPIHYMVTPTFSFELSSSASVFLLDPSFGISLTINLQIAALSIPFNVIIQIPSASTTLQIAGTGKAFDPKAPPSKPEERAAAEELLAKQKRREKIKSGVALYVKPFVSSMAGEVIATLNLYVKSFSWQVYSWEGYRYAPDFLQYCVQSDPDLRICPSASPFSVDGSITEHPSDPLVNPQSITGCSMCEIASEVEKGGWYSSDTTHYFWQCPLSAKRMALLGSVPANFPKITTIGVAEAFNDYLKSINRRSATIPFRSTNIFELPKVVSVCAESLDTDGTYTGTYVVEPSASKSQSTTTTSPIALTLQGKLSRKSFNAQAESEKITIAQPNAKLADYAKSLTSSETSDYGQYRRSFFGITNGNSLSSATNLQKFISPLADFEINVDHPMYLVGNITTPKNDLISLDAIGQYQKGVKESVPATPQLSSPLAIITNQNLQNLDSFDPFASPPPPPPIVVPATVNIKSGFVSTAQCYRCHVDLTGKDKFLSCPTHSRRKSFTALNSYVDMMSTDLNSVWSSIKPYISEPIVTVCAESVDSTELAAERKSPKNSYNGKYKGYLFTEGRYDDALSQKVKLLARNALENPKFMVDIKQFDQYLIDFPKETDDSVRGFFFYCTTENKSRRCIVARAPSSPDVPIRASAHALYGEYRKFWSLQYSIQKPCISEPSINPKVDPTSMMFFGKPTMMNATKSNRLCFPCRVMIGDSLFSSAFKKYVSGDTANIRDFSGYQCQYILGSDDYNSVRVMSLGLQGNDVKELTSMLDFEVSVAIAKLKSSGIESNYPHDPVMEDWTVCDERVVGLDERSEPVNPIMTWNWDQQELESSTKAWLNSIYVRMNINNKSVTRKTSAMELYDLYKLINIELTRQMKNYVSTGSSWSSKGVNIKDIGSTIQPFLDEIANDASIWRSIPFRKWFYTNPATDITPINQGAYIGGYICQNIGSFVRCFDYRRPLDAMYSSNRAVQPEIGSRYDVSNHYVPYFYRKQMAWRVFSKLYEKCPNPTQKSTNQIE